MLSFKNHKLMNEGEMYEKIKEIIVKDPSRNYSLYNMAVELGYKSSGSFGFVKNINLLLDKNLIKLKENGKRKYVVLVNQEVEREEENEKFDFNVNVSKTPQKITEEYFKNIKVKILDSDIGKVIPIADIYNGLKIPRQQIHNTITKHKEIFNNKKVMLRCTNNVKQICLTKDGIITLFMKLDYNKMREDKKQLIIDFQNWAMEKLGQLISKGKVELTDMEQAKVQDNIKESLELTEDDIDKLFNDIEDNLLTFMSNINNLKVINKKRKEELEKVENEKSVLKGINDKYRIKTLQLQERINELKWS